MLIVTILFVTRPVPISFSMVILGFAFASRLSVALRAIFVPESVLVSRPMLLFMFLLGLITVPVTSFASMPVSTLVLCVRHGSGNSLRKPENVMEL